APLFNKLTDVMGSLDTTITNANRYLNQLIERLGASSGKRITRASEMSDEDKMKFGIPVGRELYDWEKGENTNSYYNRLKRFGKRLLNRGEDSDSASEQTGAAPATSNTTEQSEIKENLQILVDETRKANAMRERQLRSTPGKVDRSSTLSR